MTAIVADRRGRALNRFSASHLREALNMRA
jgi:hypothetical protein